MLQKDSSKRCRLYSDVHSMHSSTGEDEAEMVVPEGETNTLRSTKAPSCVASSAERGCLVAVLILGGKPSSEILQDETDKHETRYFPQWYTIILRATVGMHQQKERKLVTTSENDSHSQPRKALLSSVRFTSLAM